MMTMTKSRQHYHSLTIGICFFDSSDWHAATQRQAEREILTKTGIGRRETAGKFVRFFFKQTENRLD